VSDALAAGDVALLEAARADVHLTLVTIHDNGNTLDVGTELAVDGTERVGDRTASDRVLAADLTNLGHDSNLHRRRSGEGVASSA